MRGGGTEKGRGNRIGKEWREEFRDGGGTVTGRGSRIIGELFLRGTEKGRGSRIIEEQLSGVTGGGQQGRAAFPGAGEKGAQNELTGVYFDIFFGVKWSTKRAQN